MTSILRSVVTQYSATPRVMTAGMGATTSPCPTMTYGASRRSRSTSGGTPRRIHHASMRATRSPTAMARMTAPASACQPSQRRTTGWKTTPWARGGRPSTGTNTTAAATSPTRSRGVPLPAARSTGSRTSESCCGMRKTD